MSATRLRVCRNSGETQEIKTGGWFMDSKLQLWSQKRTAIENVPSTQPKSESEAEFLQKRILPPSQLPSPFFLPRQQSSVLILQGVNVVFYALVEGFIRVELSR